MIIESAFSGTECSLEEILESREKRVLAYSSLLKKYKCRNVVTLCVNMPGKIKKNQAASLFYHEGCRLLKQNTETFVFEKEICSSAGYESYFGTNRDSLELKRIIVNLERQYKWMRMLDIDVIDRDSGHISRTQVGEKPLPCFVCGNDAKTCGSQRLHSEEEIKKAITGFYAELVQQKVSDFATDSLVHEAACTPKPGLVDCNNNGSHKDMNVDILFRSAKILGPFFGEMCGLGFSEADLSQLRNLGKTAESEMYKITNGVNTHKGAIFCLGLLSYSFGFCLTQGIKPEPVAICRKVKNLSKDMACEVSKEVLEKRGLGARGQAIDGYSIITEKALPYFKEEIKKSSINRALSLTLLLILSETEDSNILSRSDTETLKWAKIEAFRLFKKKANEKEIENLDRQFIKKNISPGGCADLLCATYFLYKLSGLYFNE